MIWIPEQNEMCYKDEAVKIKSLENNSLLFHGVIQDLRFVFNYSPDNVVSDNSVGVYPYIFHYTKMFPHNIVGYKNRDVTQHYNHEITYVDIDERKKDYYSPHIYSIEKENGQVLFHARLEKRHPEYESFKPPYSLLRHEKTQSGTAYSQNMYYCPLKQIVAAGQSPLEYSLTSDPIPWYYELEHYVARGDLYYSDGRIVTVDSSGDSVKKIEKSTIKLGAWKKGQWYERKVWYAAKYLYSDGIYTIEMRVVFESDFTENALFEFNGILNRESLKRSDTKYGYVAYFSVDGIVSTIGKEGGETNKHVLLYNDKNIVQQNFTTLFMDSVFAANNSANNNMNPTDLNDLIGLVKVKETFEDFRCFGKFLRKLKSKTEAEPSGDRLHDIFKKKPLYNSARADDDSVALHMAFLGSPGTGKTTVAERVAAMLKYYGLVVQNEKPVVVVKSDLVGKYIGETEDIVKKKIQEAMGGVLFIDEAYALFEGKGSRDFGNIALNEIMYAMEHYRDKLVVVFAGYTDEMFDMLKNANPGLASRIPWKFYFEDYSAAEMWEIFFQKVTKGGFKFEYVLSAKELATKYFDELKAAYDNIDENGSKKYYFGNGRGVRNFYQYMQMGLAKRCHNSEADNRIFTEDDIDYAYYKIKNYTQELAFSKKAGKIGF